MCVCLSCYCCCCWNLIFEISNIHDHFTVKISPHWVVSIYHIGTTRRTNTQPERSVSETGGAHKRFSSMLKSNCLVHLPIEVVAGSPPRLLLCESAVWCLLAFYHVHTIPKKRIYMAYKQREKCWCVKTMCSAGCCCCFDSISMLSFNVLFPAYTFIHSFTLSLSHCLHVLDAATAVATGGIGSAADVACWMLMLMLLLMSYPHFYTVSTMHKSRPMPPLSMLYCVVSAVLFLPIFSLFL